MKSVSDTLAPAFRKSAFLFFLAGYFLSSPISKAQNGVFPENLKKSMIANLKSGDSLTFYQCHVEFAEQQIKTAGGQTLTTAPEKYSITEKLLVKRKGDEYTVKHFVSSMMALPNRKFSGQKIKERSYWNYKLLKEEKLSERDLRILGAIEFKGHEPNEYEFTVSKDNPNMVLIKQRKNFKQLVDLGDFVLSKAIFK